MTTSILDELAADTWYRLRDAQSLGVRFGEETITDLLLLDLKRRGPRGLRFIQTTKHQEKTQGTDFEWWIGSDSSRWLRFAVQAKKIHKSGRYDGLKHKVGRTLQIDLLERYAKSNRAKPLYCFYNFTPSAKKASHWHCCQEFEPPQLGVSIALPSTVRATFHAWGTKNFNHIHQHKCSLPWRCMARCPRAQRHVRGKPQKPIDRQWAFELMAGETNTYGKLPESISAARQTGILDNFADDVFSTDEPLPKRILLYDIDDENEPIG